MKKVATVSEYITTVPAEAKETFLKLREIVVGAAPAAEEYISYQMPALRLNGPLVYFAAFKNHCSLFPGNSRLVSEQFADELEGYVTSKGTIQFPLNKPLPAALIRKIVKLRVKENEKLPAKNARS